MAMTTTEADKIPSTGFVPLVREPGPTVQRVTEGRALPCPPWSERLRTDDGESAVDASPHGRRTHTISDRSLTFGREHHAESRLQGICTPTTQPGHGVRGFCTDAHPPPCHWRGVPDFVEAVRVFTRTDAVTDVKESPTSRAQACTDEPVRRASAQVRAVVDWKREPRPCFDPSHRGGRSGLAGTDARGRGRHLSPEGAAPPL
jgi:hypothetical protein